MASYGPRPTASPSHTRFVNSIARRVSDIPGIRMRSLRYEIDRWLERDSALSAAPAGGAQRTLADAGAVPYSKPTPAGGVRAPLVYLPPGAGISESAARGRIVVRDAVPGSIPNAVLAALMWSMWDPDLGLLDPLGTYERDFLGYDRRVDDLRAAAAAGAAGIIFVHGFPRRQVAGHYAPYEGERWRVPGVYVGADEGDRLKQLAAHGGSARIVVSARRDPAETRTVVATLPGVSEERIVLTSHTDGMNAIWDNGPVAMLALAEYFAGLPRECRPRTLEFGFTTAHLYQQLEPGVRTAGAGKYAQELDRGYDEGTVALVMAMEHMGAREYGAVPRADGGPGREIVPTGRNEPSSFFTGISPVLIAQTTLGLIRHDIRRSIVLRGADLPGVHLPPHHSFGGEGTAYHNRLLPTVALVTGPWSLFNPAFGIEAVDGDLLRRQTLLFGDLAHQLASVPRPLIAGGYLVERDVRALLCGLDPSGYGLVQCMLN